MSDFAEDIKNPRWLLNREKAILGHLNKRENTSVPTVYRTGDDFIDMAFIDGFDIYYLDYHKSLDTALDIFNELFQEIENVFNDGVTSVDYSETNAKVIFDLEGNAKKVTLFDFGHGLFIDLDTNTVTIEPELVTDLAKWGADRAVPPEVAAQLQKDQKKNIVVDAEKMTVFLMGSILARMVGIETKIHNGGEFEKYPVLPEDISFDVDSGERVLPLIKKMMDLNPEQRPSFVELKIFIEELLIPSNIVIIPDDFYLKGTRRQVEKMKLEAAVKPTRLVTEGSILRIIESFD